MYSTAKGVQYGFMHRLGQRRVREYRMHQLGFRGFKRLADDETLDQFRHLRPDHMAAEQLTRGGVEYRCHQAGSFVEGDGLAVGGQGETSHLDLPTCFERTALAQPDAGDLRIAVGARRYAYRIDRVEIAQ